MFTQKPQNSLETQRAQFPFFQGKSNPIVQQNLSTPLIGVTSMNQNQNNTTFGVQSSLFNSANSQHLSTMFSDPLKSAPLFSSNPFMLSGNQSQSQPQSLFNPTPAAKSDRHNSSHHRSAASRKAKKNEVRIS
jgi:hypothetical protein